jgi:hypothetical protein
MLAIRRLTPNTAMLNSFFFMMHFLQKSSPSGLLLFSRYTSVKHPAC